MTSLVLTAVFQAAILVTPGQDYSTAYQKSLDTGRPLVVLLGAPWCPACLTMKNSVLPEVVQNNGLKDVEFTYVDVDQNLSLANRLAQGRSIPQLIRFEKTTKGWDRQYLFGIQTSDAVTTFVKGKPHAQASSAAPVKPTESQATTQLTSLPTPAVPDTK
jgi:thiol-disulfide isomerase/thioredoxin